MSKQIRILLVALLFAAGGVAGAAAASTAGASGASQTVQSTSIAGEVVGPDGAPVEGATVRVPLAETTLRTTTDADGRFALSTDDVAVPEQAVVVAEKPGTLPRSRLVDTTGGESVRLRLGAGGQRSIVIDSGVYHVGDDSYDGSANSQFQTETIGETVSRTFRLNAVQTEASGATLAFRARGVEASNEISVNGRTVGRMANTPEDGSAVRRTVDVDPGVLREGENTVRFEAAESNSGFSFGDVDDFEVSNLQLGLDGVPTDEEKPTVSLSAPSTVPLGSEASINLRAEDNNRVAVAGVTIRRDGEVVETRTAGDGELDLTRTFDRPGTYAVTTQVSDQSGNVETDERTFRVSNVYVTTMLTDPSVPRPDGTTDVATVVGSAVDIDEPVPMELRVDGETAATKELDGLSTGQTGVQWEDVDLDPGAQNVSVVVDPDGDREQIVGTPSATIRPRVPPLVIEKAYTEPVTPDAGEQMMTAGNTHTVVQVTNPLDRPVTASMGLLVDGESVEHSREATVEPGHSQRLLFPWNSRPGSTHELDIDLDADEGSSYRLSGSYHRPARGEISRTVPTQIVRVDTNTNIAFRLWGETLGGVSVTRDAETEEIQSVSVPYSAPEEFPISVTVENLEGDVVGEAETTADGQFGSVTVPVDVEEDTEYVRIDVEEQGSVRNFAGQVMMGYTGMNAIMGLENVGEGHGQGGTAPVRDTSMTYRGVVVAQLSDYPPSDEFVELQQNVREDELWKREAGTAIDVAGVLAAGASAVSSTGSAAGTADDVFTAYDVAGAADDNAQLNFDGTDISVDTSDLRMSTDVARVDAVEFDSKPAYVDPPAHRTAMRYVDVKSTGYFDGDAGVEVGYSESTIRTDHIEEDSLTMRYWDDGEWKEASNVEISSEQNEIEGDVPASKLEGTPIVIDGERKNRFEIVASNIAYAFSDRGIPPVPGIVALLALVGLGVRRRYRSSD